MYKVKNFKKSEVFVDANGEKHVIYVYGELVKTNHLDGVLVANVKYVNGDKRIVDCTNEEIILNHSKSHADVKEFNFGWAICDPRDAFDEKKAIKICKKRFGRTPLKTQEGKFLTDDMINAILENEIEYLKREKLIPLIKVNTYTSEAKDEVKNTTEREFKRGDIVKMTYASDNTTVYAAIDSIDHKNKTIFFYWKMSINNENGKQTVRFVEPWKCYTDEFYPVFHLATRSEILEVERLMEKTFCKKWNWKEKKVENIGDWRDVILRRFN